MIELKSFCIAVLLLSFVAAPARSGDPVAVLHAAPSEPEQIGIVLRISDQLLEDLTEDIVEMTMPVRRRVEGLTVLGQATGEGKTSVQLDVSDEHADFIITVTGTAEAQLHSDVGPATAFLSSRARFTSQKRVRFDGITFRDGTASTVSRNDTTVDRVCAGCRGPIGRLIEHVGQRMADDATPEINAVVEEVSQEMLSQTFDETANELIAELNQTTEFEKLVSKYFPETDRWKTRLATRERFLLAGVGPPGATFPAFVDADNGEPPALLEMWLHTTPGQAAMLELIADWNLAYDLLRDYLPEADAKELAEDVQITRRGEWSVIQVGRPESKGVESDRIATGAAVEKSDGIGQ